VARTPGGMSARILRGWSSCFARGRPVALSSWWATVDAGGGSPLSSGGGADLVGDVDVGRDRWDRQDEPQLAAGKPMSSALMKHRRRRRRGPSIRSSRGGVVRGRRHGIGIGCLDQSARWCPMAGAGRRRWTRHCSISGREWLGRLNLGLRRVAVRNQDLGSSHG
jgi:hypothetical protein